MAEQDEGLAARIGARARSCPDVARLSGGPYGAVATYLPGERLTGVAVRADAVEVWVVARYGRPLPEIAEQVRAAVAAEVPGRRVDVGIGDIVAAPATPAPRSPQ
ncbi:Asp23/Gls24 family envelope stress response protein [Allonocardiopsis opalescens]|uniref:Cell envelope-related Asp23 family protein n=1 Tax=Allonocardiopsis opalescens TaxID=1144618 RepID=A0A2T0PW60_9ACTN|nr:Asp23/Gls24 family envelope stress response protein [Allonocardiopsis opalescens]PRX95747.1 cell envelope-related Asp23 family protein [Allonocardiopsis opalescens]